VELAVREALKLGHNYIGTEHLLLGVLEDEVVAGHGALAGLGVTRGPVEQWLGAELERLAEAKRRAAGGPDA
jgi:ATP-dependent Clp protease ATP-binding subunit ClpA